MDLSNPIRSVIPSAQGEVLAVLARTNRPLTGRGVAELTDGRLSQKGVNLALRTLATAGLALVEDHPPAKLYRLNRRHLAAESIVSLSELRSRLLEAMRGELGTWEPPAVGAWLFGSAARGDGGTGSDVDVVIVRSDDVSLEHAEWTVQVDALIDHVGAWSGNPCAVIEYSETEFCELMSSDERLAGDLRSDAIALVQGRRARQLMVGRRP